MTMAMAPSGSAAGRVSAPMRLTRRGRVVLTMLGAVLAAAIGTVAVQAQASTPTEPPPSQTVVVAPGDTLWGLASTIAQDEDVRDVVVRIQRFNGLESSDLQVGQTLQLPLEG